MQRWCFVSGSSMRGGWVKNLALTTLVTTGGPGLRAQGKLLQAVGRSVGRSVGPAAAAAATSASARGARGAISTQPLILTKLLKYSGRPVRANSGNRRAGAARNLGPQRFGALPARGARLKSRRNSWEPAGPGAVAWRGRAAGGAGGGRGRRGRRGRRGQAPTLFIKTLLC
jgi:hypothetical protein